MRPAEPGAGQPVRTAGPPPRKGAIATAWIACAAVALLAGATAGWWVRTHPPQHPAVTASIPAPATAPAPPVATPAPALAPSFQIETADEQQIRDHVPTGLTVFRFADNPNILVLDFASLHDQGMMLNRVAALIEKAGLPRDRVLTDAELDAAIRAQGDTVESFYYGHDYPVTALARFFALADQQHIALDPQEEQLRHLMQQLGWFAPGVTAGLISLPAVGADRYINLAARAAILRHELSHGEFFSDPAYAAYVHNFWLTELTEDERAAVRKFLGNEDYDVHDEELMYNEMQAYLMFTRDPTFFTPNLADLTPERLAEIQSRFLAGMPKGWLRNVLASYQTAASAQ
jgi:hypothetical protein